MGRFRGMFNKHGDDAMLVIGFLLALWGFFWNRNLGLILGGVAIMLIEFFTESEKKEGKHA